jgi:outer membrane protein assembly factor BamB
MHRSQFEILVICVIVAALCGMPVMGQEDEQAAVSSYMAGYDPGHSGVSALPVGLPLALTWRHSPEVTAAVKIVGSAAVGAENVYFPAHDAMYAVDRRTGEQRWKLSAGSPVYSTPLLHKGVLYFGSDNKQLWAVDSESGHRLWQFPTGGAVRGSPLYVAGVLYFGSDDGRVYAMDAERQRLLWRFETRDGVAGAPCYHRDTVYAASADGYLYAISARDGKMVWRAPLGSEDVFVAPVMERNKVVVAAGNKLMAFDTRRAVRRWTFTSGGLITGAPATYGRRIYLGSNDGVVYCLDSNNGRIIWRFPTEGVRKGVSGPLSISGDVLYARFGKTNLAALSVTNGSLLWEYRLPTPKVEEATAKQDGAGSRGAEAGGGPADLDGDAGPPGADMGPEGGPEGMPGPGGRRGSRGRTQAATTTRFEDVVTPGLSLSENSGYIVAADGVLYGFETFAADNVKPQITAGLLDVPGRGNIQVRYPLVLDRADTFAGRYADLVEVPGSPPLSVSVVVMDSGTGLDPEGLTMEMDGTLLETTYDAQQGLLWYIYAPRGAAGALGNGIRNIVISARDWAGNEAKAQMAFTVDNSLEPPGPKEPEARQPGDPGAEGMPGDPPEPGMMPPPGPPM